MRMGSSCLPARDDPARSSSLLRFLSSRTVECMGNGGPGVTECTPTAGRLGLGPLGLEGDALGLSALLARDHDNQLFLGLGRRRVWAEMAHGTSDCLGFGDGRDYLVDGSCSRRRQLERACRTSRTLLVRARTRAHTASERISSRGSLAEPGLRRQRREQVPRELLPQCYRSSTPVEPCLEVLPRSCLLDRQISLSEWLPTDEPCRRRHRRGGIPLPRSIRTLVLAEQVPTRSHTQLAALASES
jgi:hypothetical protein